MNLHEKLKTGTRSQHDSLEKGLDLMRGDLSLNEYSEILIKFHGFYEHLSRSISNSRIQLKLDHLREDLQYLNVPKDKLKKFSASEEFRPHTEASKLGVRYVIEGSTLGGLVLTKHFSKKFDLCPSKGVTFFNGYGEETLPMWREFLKELEESSQREKLDKEEILFWAKLTFTTLEGWLLDSK